MKKYNLKPKALKTLGEDIFIKVPLYEAKEEYTVKYVNEELFAQYFKDKNTNFEHMSEVIRQEFSTTIDVNKSNGNQVGYAYVDMQDDPLKISMSGNLGSGRAFYQGDVFNIKGEKTPLVRSKRPEYSNGVLEFEKSMYETISSNSLYNDTNIKLSPILAILDIQEPCKVSWKEKVCKRAKVVRMDIDGSLNRITHIFKSKKQLTAQEMFKMAEDFGHQDGEKFIQRIEHGAWSAGNISQYAHMIDFDTVSAIRYRAPQFSFCVWFIENYFGYECLGQAKILKSLVDDIEINVDKVTYKDLKKMMFDARKQYLLDNFTRLMGFKIDNQKYSSDIKRLFKLFYKLSTKCYPIPENLSCKNPDCYKCSPFDFSKFFRYYPILKRTGNFEEFAGYQILVDSMKDFNDFDIDNFDQEDPNNSFFYKHALLKLNKNFIHNIDEFLALSKECLNFIKMYDSFYEKLTKKKCINLADVERTAYKFNEDRVNMFLPYSPAGQIDDNVDELSSYQVHKAIAATIIANKRNPNHKIFNLTPTDVKIYKNGYFAILLNDNYMHKLSLNIYNNCLKIKDTDIFEVSFSGQTHKCSILQENDIISIQTDSFDNANLLSNLYDDVKFYRNSKEIRVN